MNSIKAAAHLLNWGVGTSMTTDETTVYLLADGRYMDRINAVYIYDGKDTWTDESGVEWNKADRISPIQP